MQEPILSDDESHGVGNRINEQEELQTQAENELEPIHLRSGGLVRRQFIFLVTFILRHKDLG